MLKNIFITLLIISFSLVSSPPLSGGNTGKIIGKATSQDSGEPLIAANIYIVGTTLGAATDINGSYFINNVPPGTFTVRATMMGYKQVEMQNVKVSADLTTEVNFRLEEAVLEGEVITLVAERPLVAKDVTAKMAIVSGEDISERMPVTSVQDVLTTQAGFVESESGALHLRGGRSDEVAYYIDGVLVQNPLQGGLGTSIDVNMIQELSVLTGGFNAEYGDAMSGIINITTKEGASRFSGKIQYESPMLNSSPYHQPDWLLDTDIVKGLSEQQKVQYRDEVRYYESADDTIGKSQYQHVSVIDDPVGKDHILIPILGKFNGTISGPVAGINGLSFFASGVFSNEDSYLPWGFNLDRQLFGKLTFRISPTMKLAADVQNTWNYRQVYSHSYKYITPVTNDPQDQLNYNTRLLGSRGLRRTLTDRQTIAWTHTLNRATFYTINFQRLFRQATRDIPGKEVYYDPETGAMLDKTDYVKLTYISGAEGGFSGGDDRDWYRQKSTTYNLKFDLISQIHHNHQLKAGLDLKQYLLFRHAIRDPWPGAFRHRLEYYNRDPWEAAIYLQDKMEYDFMILNIGVRLDYAQANDTYWDDPGDIQQTVSIPNPDGSTTKIFQFNQRKPVPDRFQISPRIGLAHPVTERLVFHFAYGHFFQNPDYYHLFRNDRSLLNLEESDVIIGNPGLRPQRTVAFEVGGKLQVAADVAIDFTGFYKDIYDLTSTRYYSRQPYNYTIYVNEDYGRVKGFDITLIKKYSKFFSGNLNYTYSVAKGSGSDPLAGYYFREEEAHLRPKREFFLDFDRTHDFSANLDVRFPDKFGPNLTGFRPLSGVGMNVLFQIASGLPYTPSERGAISLEINSERKGWNSTLDIRIDKRITLMKTIDMIIYAKATNLLDRLNTLYIWSETGEPWNAGPYTYRSKDRQANPANVGTRRDIRLGAYIKF
ncbi:MAG TPA: TonB-dependent receptor [bacterium]|nr:TonB-dependent receptor [bacterium]